MKYAHLIAFLFILGTFSSCVVPKSDYDKLKTSYEALKLEKSSLERQIDEEKNGLQRLFTSINRAYLSGKFDEAKTKIEIFNNKYPESLKNKEFRKLLAKIKNIEKAQEKRAKVETEKKFRLQNINNTGMWVNSFYTDKFGDPTNEAVITHEAIEGTFSNSATQESPLKARILIDSDSLAILLYEYAGNNPVKAYSDTKYSVGIKDRFGKKYQTIAVNSSDRLYVQQDDGKPSVIDKVLRKGGKIQFFIEETEDRITQYEFTIENADWYENAYKRMMKK